MTTKEKARDHVWSRLQLAQLELAKAIENLATVQKGSFIDEDILRAVQSDFDFHNKECEIFSYIMKLIELDED